MTSSSSDRFAWSEYLKLAEHLRQATDIASHRSAVSRAYYAAYHAARSYLGRKNERIQDQGNVHQIVWERVGNYLQRAGIVGGRLRRMRQWADYESSKMNEKAQAEQATSQAKWLVSTLDPED